MKIYLVENPHKAIEKELDRWVLLRAVVMAMDERCARSIVREALDGRPVWAGYADSARVARVVPPDVVFDENGVVCTLLGETPPGTMQRSRVVSIEFHDPVPFEGEEPPADLEDSEWDGAD